MNPYESPTHCEAMEPFDWYGWTHCAIGCASFVGMLALGVYWLYECRPGQPERGPAILIPYFVIPIHALGFGGMYCLDAIAKRDLNKSEKEST